MVESRLPKPLVAGSIPVSRSSFLARVFSPPDLLSVVFNRLPPSVRFGDPGGKPHRRYVDRARRSLLGHGLVVLTQAN